MTEALKQKQAARRAKPALKIRADVSLRGALDDFSDAWKCTERGEKVDISGTMLINIR